MVNSSDLHWATPEKLREDAVAAGPGVYDAYRKYVDGTDIRAIAAHAIIDDDYARLYADNLAGQLTAMGLPRNGAILDLGCGPGTVTAALGRTIQSPATGIDLASYIVATAERRYPDCRFLTASADDLSIFPDRNFALIHAREFYPYSRVADTTLHLRFLSAAAPKLVSGGLFLVVQIVDKHGLSENFSEVSAGARNLGFGRTERHVMVPQRLYRRFGKSTHSSIALPVIALAGRLLEFWRSGYVTFLYCFWRT